MKLNRAKILHLSHIILKVVEEDSSVEFFLEPNDLRLKFVDIIQRFLKRDEDVERAVVQKIESQKKKIPEGSQEWDILFRKYYEEEIDKMRKIK